MEEIYIMKNHVNIPTLQNVPTGGYVSKRNLLNNRPLAESSKYYIIKDTSLSRHS